MFYFAIYDRDENLITELSVPRNSLALALQVAVEYGTDLSNADLQGQNLDGLQAAGAQFSRASFSQSSLVEANFKGAVLNGTSFVHANLTGSVFTGSSINEVTDFTGAVLIDTIYETGNEDRPKPELTW